MEDTLRTKLYCSDPAFYLKLDLWITLANLLEYKAYDIEYDYDTVYGLGGRFEEHVLIGVTLWSGDVDK